ncbi:ataxin-2 isoform X3 [Siniperca chuatsi]|uniref:ataxin-2 isoform X3 n=1 Tax=Siniperca chuatsi TaxID=119488 RepID=UPI001CE1C066|nr:ataxin-2 isoform X3 [Siniperca chuatsi]
MSMKAGGNRSKPGGGNTAGAAASGAGGSGGGRQNLGRGRHSGKGPAAVIFNGVYANMRMVHVLTSVVGTKCELKVKNGAVYEGVFKTYGPECDLVLDAAHRKSPEPSIAPRKQDIVESIIFKASDVVVVTFKDVDLNFARKVSSDTDNFTDAAVSSRINGEHKEKDLEPWDGGETHNSDSLESLDTDVAFCEIVSVSSYQSNGWDPNDMFKYNEEKYGVLSTYDSSLSTYTVPLERDNSEEFLKREARAAQLAEEIEASATYKARVALENDERSEEEKYTAVVRGERETHTLSRENKYIPPGQRNREAMSWGPGRQNSPRLAQSSAGPPAPRPGPHDYSPSSGADQRVVNGGSSHWPSPCPSPSSRPPSRYQSGPSSLPPRATTPTRPPSRPPSRPSRPPSHSSHPSYPSSSSSFSHHGPTSPASTLPKRMSSEASLLARSGISCTCNDNLTLLQQGPPRMSPKSQRTPRAHRVPPCRTTGVPPGVDLISHSGPGEVPVTPPTRSNSSGGTWSSVVSGAHRPRSPRQNSMGGASPGPSSLPSPQTGTAPVETAATPTSASSPTAASPTPNMVASPSGDAKECRVQETRQTSPTANKENIKPLDSSPSITRPVCKGPPSMAPDHRKQIDNLKKFSVDFRLQSSSNSDPAFDQMMTKSPRDPADKPKDLDKASTVGREGTEEGVVGIAAGGAPASSTTTTNTSKPGSPAALSPSPSAPDQKRAGLDVTSQGVQTTSTFSGAKHEEKEEKKEAVQDQVRKSTLNPNANEFKPRFNTQPKPANTPTPPRPQGQPSPSIVVQQPPTVYGQTVCFPQMYPLTPVSPGVQKSIIWKSPAMYQVQMPHMTVSQSKPYRPVPNMPQQRSDQHHPQGTPTMMHQATAAGPPIVAQSPAYSAQYFTCSPQQFTSQPLVQQMTHYQSQAQHVFSPVMQGSARMMAPPTHGQPSLVSSSTTQYPEQTHTMYGTTTYHLLSPGPMPQQYPHPSATLHPHPQHPQPSATPTGQAQQGGPPQHGGPPSHPAASPVQHPQHQQAAAAAAAAQALHMANQAPQQQMYSALAHTPPSMTPGPNPQSPQASFPSAQQTVYIHPQQVQHGYNHNHMAHVQQAHMQSGMVPSHHPAPTHPTMMLMATQGPGGPQPQMPQTALNPIPVSSTTHFSYLAHPQVQPHHQQQL